MDRRRVERRYPIKEDQGGIVLGEDVVSGRL